MKSRISFSALILFALMLNLSCSKGEKTNEKTGEWRGRIENENGIKMDMNMTSTFLILMLILLSMDIQRNIN